MGIWFWNNLNQRFSLVPGRRPLNIFTTVKIRSGGILHMRMIVKQDKTRFGEQYFL